MASILAQKGCGCGCWFTSGCDPLQCQHWCMFLFIQLASCIASLIGSSGGTLEQNNSCGDIGVGSWWLFSSVVWSSGWSLIFTCCAYAELFSYIENWECVLPGYCRYVISCFFSISILLIRLLQEACDINYVKNHPEIHYKYNIYIYI